MPDKRREELWCMECEHYVQFTIDYDLDGCHEFQCPNCDHWHYRVVKDGRITNERWAIDPNGRPTGSTMTYGTGTSTTYMPVYTITSTASCTASTTSIDTWDSGTSSSNITTYTTYSSNDPWSNQ